MNNKLTEQEISELFKTEFNNRIENSNDHNREIDLAIKCFLDSSIKAVYPLEEKETSIIRERFGINDERIIKTLDEVAKMNGYESGERIRQIVLKSLKTLCYRITALKNYGLLDNFISEKLQKIMFISPSYESFEKQFQSLSIEEQELYANEKEKACALYKKSLDKDVPIENVFFDVKHINAFKRAGKNTVSDVLSMSQNELLKLRNTGENFLKTTTDTLHSYGYKNGDVFIENYQINSQSTQTFNKEEQMRDFYKKGIIDTKTLTVLLRSGKETVGDVLKMTKDEFLGIRNFGIKGYENLVEKMHSLGFKFRDEQQEENQSTSTLNANDNLETITERRNELLSKGKQLTEERDTLLQQESILDSRIASVVQNKGNIQNGTTKKIIRKK